jgi:hypothetical protein
MDGPVLANRIYFSSAFQYVLDKVPDRTLFFPNNVSKQESLNSFTQFDFILSGAQLVTATLHLSPQHTNFVNPDFFNPQPVTPSYQQQNYFGTLAHHWGIFGGLVDSVVSIQRFDANVGGQGAEEMVLMPQGSGGNFFGLQHRAARRTEWLETWSLPPVRLAGSHLIKMGMSRTNLGSEGRFTYRPIDIENYAGQLEQRITFDNLNRFNRTDLEITAFFQDHWTPFKKISIDAGGRVEHQRVASSLRIAPRGGIASARSPAAALCSAPATASFTTTCRWIFSPSAGILCAP